MSDDRWVALHVFYASDANPILVEAVRPLVEELREEQRIDGWFFIKYWMEGPHIRVRFKPSSPELRDEVTRRATDALEAFLKRRPALYDTDVDGLDEIYKRMYLAEYGEDSWRERYGDGQMPMRQNNTVALMPYEPESDRYGGPVGMDMAEWHFEHSSDMVAGLLATTNTHVRPVLLGMATQLSLLTAYTFLSTDDSVRLFFQRYRDFWETSYQESSDDYHASFDKSFERTRETLIPRIDRIRTIAANIGGGRGGGHEDGGGDAGDGGNVARRQTEATDDTERALSSIERTWLTHCAELRGRVLDAADRGDLIFPSRADEQRSPTEDPETLATVLLSSYIHMTNNRLGVAILDEIYLSYLIERALEPAEELMGSA